ncbi:alpha/beta hydrolase family protein [Povalibacter uvarum]|nr:alpha/beta family hydrolase [Povalibacter uvarum]
MEVPAAEPLTLRVSESQTVSGLLIQPPTASACYVFAHSAGAGMAHASMSSLAEGFASMGIATLRYQFPYMERGSKRPDPPPLCHATVRAAVQAARERMPSMPLIAGGRSFGGRMTSQAQAIAPLANVRGLVFLGFPLHPAGKPGIERAQHLADIAIPMLFVQGTNDDLASLDLLQPIIGRLVPRATLHILQDADHSFHVPARSGRKDAQVREEAQQAVASWLQSLQ